MTRRLSLGAALGWLAFLLPLGLYAASTSPHVAYWDTAEMQTVPYILGIAHPTGFPAFVLIGWAFTHLFAIGTVAWRMGILCGIAMAGAACLCYWLARGFGVEPPVALASALLFAVGTVAWTRGTRAEVHAFVAFFAALALMSSVRWYRTGDRRSLVWLGVAIGLGIATHLVIGLLLPGVALLLLGRRRELTPARLALPVAIVAASLALYLYLPLRSAYVTAHHLDPTSRLGVPAGRPYWDYAHPSSLAGLRRELAGSDFNVGQGLAGIVSPARYVKTGTLFTDSARDEFGWIALIAALFGFALVARDEPMLAGGLFLAVLLPVSFVVSYRAESDVERYFLPSFWLIAAMAGVGLSRGVAAYLRERSRLSEVLAAVTIAILVVQVLVANRATFAQRTDDEAEKYVDRVIARTPDRSIVIANWAYATPLAYAAYVQGRMGQRLVETAWVGDDSDYLGRWLEQRPVYTVVQEGTPDIDGFQFIDVDQGYPGLFRVTR
jgi:4-amino-4-deoxy-L-arabinose transferase-like glycosyltransferase